MRYYDPNLSVFRQTKASSVGLGAVMFQQEAVVYASRALTDCELKHTPVDAQRNSTSCSSGFYCTDHKPLESKCTESVSSHDVDRRRVAHARSRTRLHSVRRRALRDLGHPPPPLTSPTPFDCQGEPLGHPPPPLTVRASHLDIPHPL